MKEGGLLDLLDRLVDLEGITNRLAALGADIGAHQAEIEGGNTIRNVVTAAVTTFRSFLILLPPSISAWVTTSSAPRAALRLPRPSRSTKPSRASSEPPFLHFSTRKFCYRRGNNIPIIPNCVTPSDFRLGDTGLGPEGSIAIAEALKVNKTIKTIE
jgi:hypothetical protein